MNVSELITKANQRLVDQKDKVTKLELLLVIRDGGGHDVDCKANYNRQCNCGHDSVKEYFKETTK